VKKKHLLLGAATLAAVAWWTKKWKRTKKVVPATAVASEKPGVTLLLGAGFSQGLGIAGTAALSSCIDAVLLAGAHASAYEALKARLETRFGTRYNFEILVAALESCRVFGRPSPLPGAPDYASVIPEIADLRNDLSVDAADAMFQVAMGIIDAEIGKNFTSRLSAAQCTQMIAFFNALRGKWQLNVGTLNYDHGVEMFVPDIFDGFVGSGNPQQFDSTQFMLPDGRPRIAHIHGDLQFGITQGEKRFVKYSAGRSGPRQDLMWTSRLDGIVWSGFIAGGDKADKIVLQPYSIYYAWLARVLLDSPRMVVVGYGVGDLHINAWLANAALHHQRSEYRAVFIDRFAGGSLPQHLLQMAAIAAGIGNRGSAPEFDGLSWTDDIAVYGPVMIIRSGIPLNDSQRKRMMEHLG
jgi:hypothetical protein